MTGNWLCETGSTKLVKVNLSRKNVYGKIVVGNWLQETGRGKLAVAEIVAIN